MEKASSEEPVQGPPPDGLKLRKLMVNLGNAFVRLTAADLRKVMRLIQHFAFGKNRTVSYWEHWSNDGLKFCCLQMKPISPKMANDFRRWAAELLRTGGNNNLALKCLMDELVCRRWLEEP